MKLRSLARETGNIILTTLGTILVLSLVGANVLLNCTTRYNVTARQVKGWKAALTAAEAGGDVAYATIRKAVGTADPTSVFSGDGWAATAASPSPVWTKTVSSFGENGSLSAQVTVDTLPSGNISPPDTNYYYRVRSTGTARVFGLARTGMDDRMDVSTHGDSILRKIDFVSDHFIAAYGPNGDGLAAQVTPVPYPQVSRRVELITSPVRLFEVAVKAGGTFYGLGSAAYIDSFRSRNGPYDSNVKTDPSSPYFTDSRSGSVQINAGTATIKGDIYGNVYTNNGTVTGTTSNIISPGIIDNNIAFTQDSFTMPSTAGWNSLSTPASVSGNTTISPSSAGTAAAPNFYRLSSFSTNGDLTIRGVTSGAPTYVNIQLSGDFGTSSGTGPKITTDPNVVLKFYYSGNWQTKAENIINKSGLAANLQFFNTSTAPTTIDLNSGGGSSVGFAAAFYAPYADMTINGAPDITGSVTVHNFYANGNVHWHYDRDLYSEGTPVDYRVASFVEDTR